MHQIMILMAKEMPEEVLLEKLQEALTEYKITKSDEARNSLGFSCALFHTRIATEGKNTKEAIDDFGKKKKTLDIFEDRPG